MSYSIDRIARPSGAVPGAIITCTIGGSSPCWTRFSVTVIKRIPLSSPVRPCPSCHTMSGDGTFGSTPGDAYTQ